MKNLLCVILTCTSLFLLFQVNQLKEDRQELLNFYNNLQSQYADLKSDYEQLSKPASSAPVSSKSTASTGEYVGSVNSDKFHYPSCSSAKAIYDENKIWFSSRDSAVNKGYVPCKRCYP